VYNTTNSLGTVLVGEGGVWLYVSGSNGSTNGTHRPSAPNGSGATPIGGGQRSTDGAVSAMVALGFAAAVVAGAGLGGLGGFLAGRGSIRREATAAGSPGRRPPTPEPVSKP
jgi:hypothetical protein